mmetsp:Transcript_61344/g.138865  ORF Transcript_61344/g.138865 Transcript_61344/m.138865 type:complete len:177 (+) Transcript_61344:385-915(+)
MCAALSSVQGFVHTHDQSTRLLMLRMPLTHTTLSSELRCLAMDAVKSLVVEEGGETPKAVKPTTKKALAAREQLALRHCEEMMAELNDAASAEGQAVFDALHKTLDCKWVDGVAINVLDQVRIEPPYSPAQCASIDGDKDAHERIVKIVQAALSRSEDPSKASPKAAKAAAIPPGI